MPEALTIPSPADAVKTSLANPGAQTGLNGAPETTLDQQEINDLPLKGKEATHTKEEKADPEPKTQSIRSLSDTIISDDVPHGTKKEEVAVDDGKPRKGEKTADFIKRIEKERDDARNEAKQLRESTSHRAEAKPEELEALRKELSERESVIEETAFLKSKKCEEQFNKPIEKAVTSAKDLIAKFTDVKDVYQRAMALDGRERLEFLREHVEDAASTVFDRMARVDELSRDRDDALKNRAEITKTLADERTNTEQSQFLKDFDDDREDIAKKLSYYRGENAEALFKQARALVDGSAPPEDVRKAAYLAAVAPQYIAETVALRKEVATLKARIAEDGGDRATMNGRGGDNGGDSVSNFNSDGRIKPMRELVTQQVAEAARKR